MEYYKGSQEVSCKRLYVRKEILNCEFCSTHTVGRVTAEFNSKANGGKVAYTTEKLEMDFGTQTMNWAVRLAIITPTVVVALILVCLLRKLRTKCLGFPTDSEIPAPQNRGRTTLGQSQREQNNPETEESTEDDGEPDDFENQQNLRVFRNRRRHVLPELPSLFSVVNEIEGPRINLEVSVVGSPEVEDSVLEDETESELREGESRTDQPPPYSSLFYSPPPSYDAAIL